MYCNKCGKKLDLDAKFCTYCGMPINKGNSQNINYVQKTKINKKAHKQWWLWTLIIIIVLIIFWGILVPNIDISTESNLNNEYYNNNEKEEVRKEQEEKKKKEQEEKERKEQEEKKKKEQEEKERKEQEKKERQEQEEKERKEQEEKEKQEQEEYKNECKQYEYKDIARNPKNYEGEHITFTGKVIQVVEGYFNTVRLIVSVNKDEYGIWSDNIYCSYTYSENEGKILEEDIIKFYGECKGTTTYTSIFGQRITVPEVEIKYLELVEE